MATHKQQVLKKLGLPKDESLSIEELARMLKVPKEALQEVYNRGIGAWKTNIESVRLKKDFSKNPNTKKYPRSARLPKEAWAMSRVWAFINKSPGTFGKADSDIARKYSLG